MIALTKISETATTVTLGWDQVPGAEWYLFYADSERVANAPAVDKNGVPKTSIKFSKGNEPFEVVVMKRSYEGVYTVDSGKWTGDQPTPVGTVFFYDDFETFYSPSYGNTGLNPNAAPVVNGYGLYDRRSWDGAAAGTVDVVTVPGTTQKGVRFRLGAGGGATFTSRWGYRTPGWRFYGFEWLFPASWVAPDPANNAPTCAEIRYFPWVHGGGACGLAPHDDVMKLYATTGYSQGNVSGQPHDWSNGGGFKDLISSPQGRNHYPVSGPSDWWIIPDGQMNKGVVHQVIVGVKWTIANDGHYLGYWRRKGEPSWTKTVDVSGAFPTEWWGVGTDGRSFAKEQMLQGDMPALYNYGLYRGSAPAAVELYLGKVVETDSLPLCQAKLA